MYFAECHNLLESVEIPQIEGFTDPSSHWVNSYAAASYLLFKETIGANRARAGVGGGGGGGGGGGELGARVRPRAI